MTCDLLLKFTCRSSVLFAVTALLLSSPNLSAQTQPPPPARTNDAFIIGADISWVQAQEDRGVRFSEAGQEKDILQILQSHGFNYIRLRVFHDPTKPTPRDQPYSRQGHCDLEHTVAFARRVKAAGMGLLIDFHYSDSWADPGKQFTPSAWSQLSFDQLVAAMHDWTRLAIEQMRAAGVQPDMVQIGNEITPGLMIDRGGSTQDWSKLARLLKAGISAVKEVDSDIQVVLHIDKSGNNQVARRWVDAALAQGVTFDVLGLSCYKRWHGPPEGWEENINDLAAHYPQLKFLIVELAAEVAETNRIMHALPDRRGLGTFIWEPTANNNGQALFDRRGAVIEDKMRQYDEVASKYGRLIPPFHIQAHRGAGIAQPENTLEAFRYSWSIGVTPEADLRSTSDETIVCFHDSNLRRVVSHIPPSQQDRSIEQMTPDEALALEVGSFRGPQFAGQHVPLLSHVLAEMKGHPQRLLYLDIKTDKLEPLVELIRQFDAERQVIFTSTHHRLIRDWKKRVPNSLTLIWNGGKEAELRKKLETLRAADFEGITHLQIHVRVGDLNSQDPFTPSSTFLREVDQELQQRGIVFQVLPWECQDKEAYLRLLQLGADSFATDYPEITLQAVREFRQQGGSGGSAHAERP